MRRYRVQSKWGVIYVLSNCPVGISQPAGNLSDEWPNYDINLRCATAKFSLERGAVCYQLGIESKFIGEPKEAVDALCHCG